VIRIIVPCWNCVRYIEQCIISIKAQTVQEWECYILDDMSTDRTWERARELTKDDSRFSVLSNYRKLYVPGNCYSVVHLSQFHPEDICINVDGDDSLAHNGVLGVVLREYEDPDVWITYGSFDCIAEPNNIIRGNSKQIESIDDLRDPNKNWNASHLRTFKTWLFRKIKREDLIGSDGIWYPMAGDLAIMIPMLEMAGLENSKFIKEVLYKYRADNPVSDWNKNKKLQMRLGWKIKEKPQYRKLKCKCSE